MYVMKTDIVVYSFAYVQTWLNKKEFNTTKF